VSRGVRGSQPLPPSGFGSRDLRKLRVTVPTGRGRWHTPLGFHLVLELVGTGKVGVGALYAIWGVVGVGALVADEPGHGANIGSVAYEVP
jgi:hypothetical protein